MALNVRWQDGRLASRSEGGDVTRASSYMLDRRQTNSNYSQPYGTPTPTPTNNNNGGQQNGGNQQGAPLSVFTFIIAIALFILVVSFVLLRIFVRNRRLRRLGIYPESPIERLLGGAPREYEDTLVPPRLWHANIADIQAHNAGARNRAEKSVLGGNVGAGDIKKYGWDALMPVAAALPPSLYPIIYQPDAAAVVASANNAANTTNAANATGTSTNDEQGGSAIFSRIAPLRPDFWRRTTVETSNNAAHNDVEAQNGGGGGMTSNGQATVSAGGVAQNSADGVTQFDRPDRHEKIAASVNITVLISMPSHKTVFPSTKKLPTATSTFRKATNKSNGSGILIGAQGKLAEVDEGGDLDALSFKGKARRTPSLRSIRTTASAKSQGEARREAFFAQTAGQDVDGAAASDALPTTTEPMSYADDEDEELPELVFGTASVPLYSKIVAPKTGAAPAAPTLISPTCDEIMTLMATAAQARTSKPVAKPVKKASSGGDADGDAEGIAPPRRSVAGTSMEGGLSAAEEQAGLGDVVTRMMRPSNGVGAEPETYELGDLSRPSFASGPSSSNVRDAHLTSPSHQALVQGAAQIGTSDSALSRGTAASFENQVRQPAIVGHNNPASTTDLPIGATSSYSMHTARSDRHSTSTFHTGGGGDVDADGVAHIAAMPVDPERRQ